MGLIDIISYFPQVSRLRRTSLLNDSSEESQTKQNKATLPDLLRHLPAICNNISKGGMLGIWLISWTIIFINREDAGDWAFDNYLSSRSDLMG
jgi:hypothetical protein